MKKIYTPSTHSEAYDAMVKDRDRERANAQHFHNALGQCLARHARVRKAAGAVVDRWETPLWKDAPATASVIHDLRAALQDEQTVDPPRAFVALEIIDQVPRINLATLNEAAAFERAADLALANLSASEDKASDRVAFADQLATFNSVREGDYEVWLLGEDLQINATKSC